MTKTKLHVKAAYDAGYRVKDGEVFKPDGSIANIHYGTTNMAYKMINFAGYPITVHQLVAYQKFADAWLLSKLVVRHMDGDRYNNLDSNIEIGTQQENLLDIPTKQRRHMGDAGRNSKKWKTVHPHVNRFKKCLLTYEDAQEIRRKYNTGLSSQKELAREYNVRVNTIHAIIKNQTYKTQLSNDAIKDPGIQQMMTEPMKADLHKLSNIDKNADTTIPVRTKTFEELSFKRKVLVKMHQLGYRVVDGVFLTPEGNAMHIGYDGDGYPKVSKRLLDGKNTSIQVHLMVAYQKFGDEYLYSNLLVRHMDGNKLNNLDSNIELGTNKQNQLDIPREKRMELSMKMRNRKRSPQEEENYRKAVREKLCKYKEEHVYEMRRLYAEGLCYEDISRKMGIPGGIIRNIILRKTYKHIPL